MTDAQPARRGVETVVVDTERAGQRVDNFLMAQWRFAPRSLIYRLLRTGQVRVNGGRVKAAHRLEAGDRVRLPPVPAPEPADSEGSRAPNDRSLAAVQAAIVLEDRDLIVLDKPSGLASHGGSGISFGAIELMRAARPDEALELAHRLDRDTSGLLVITKKRAALREFQALMRNGGIEKRYLALLIGRIKQRPFAVEAPLARASGAGQRQVHVAADGKYARSHVTWEDFAGLHSLATVRIDTGRTHQIRVHAAHIGHPVAGDDRYGDFEANRALKEAGLKRLFLHAASLDFTLGDGHRPYAISTPLPAELSAVLDALGGRARIDRRR